MASVRPILETLAVTGFAFKMPERAVDENGLWDILVNGTNVMSKWPKARANIESLLDSDGSRKPDTLFNQGAHFTTEDPGAFDAPFFSITSSEAAAMDPQQRWALEVAYHTFENAGVRMEDLRGSRTAVFTGTMGSDWISMGSRNPDTAPRTFITGMAASLIPNKVSWYFDLKGPSLTIDTACSSGMIAFDLACQSIQSGTSSAALIIGSSALLMPELSLYLTNMNFLSPGSQSVSFDARGNGYGRGEAIVALYIKPLQQAVQDGDVIRAVVRATSSNQDGRTAVLTQPSADAQVALIKTTYAKAGLDPEKTRYVEAHGTGTAVGDPIEAEAIGRVFGRGRSSQDPVYIGSLKANVGHLEGSSGPAGIVKSIMILERGIIPPQALFQNLNPNIPGEMLNIKVPSDITPWPQPGVRRISVNSFGFGGANSHAVLDDALSYLRNNNLQGFHHTIDDERLSNFSEPGVMRDQSAVGVQSIYPHATEDKDAWNKAPKLLIWSAKDVAGQHDKLRQLTYTLAARRTLMLWRSFAIIPGYDSIDLTQHAITLSPSKPARVPTGRTGAAWIFTGQGAQYRGMGLGLIYYREFKQTLQKCDAFFKTFGCEWSLFDVIQDAKRINKPEFSQPLCTALQIALVDLLRAFNLSPAVVVGHSSGEVAAAYAVGALSYEFACKVAYFRGKLVEELRANTETPGAMLSVNLREDEAVPYLNKLGLRTSKDTGVHIACVNSPNNITLAGPEQSIDIVKVDLDSKGCFAQKLNTGIAYHSPIMQTIAGDYIAKTGILEGPVKKCLAPMISTVTGEVANLDDLKTPQYWASNLISTVKFRHALESLMAMTKTKVWGGLNGEAEAFVLTDVVEIGPHDALKRSVKETLSQVRYHTWLHRSSSVLHNTLHLMGTLYSLGYPVSVPAVNGLSGRGEPYLVDCPAYPFNHDRIYWSESRESRNWRLRVPTAGYLLGRRVADWNQLKPRWKNYLSVETTPWVGDHGINGMLLIPGMGSLIIAIEAVRHIVSGGDAVPVGFLIRDAKFLSPLRVGEKWQEAVEMEVHLDRIPRPYDKESAWYEVSVFIHRGDSVTKTFTTQIQAQYNQDLHEPAGREILLEEERFRKRFYKIRSSSTTQLNTEHFYRFCEELGFQYGASFKTLTNIKYGSDGPGYASGEIDLTSTNHNQADSPVHPALLDAVLQVMIAHASKGLHPSKRHSMGVPQGVKCAWFSNKIWTQVTNRVYTGAMGLADSQGHLVSGTWASIFCVSDDGSPLCALESVYTAAIMGENKTDKRADHRKLLYGISWKPKISSLGSHQLSRICRTRANLSPEVLAVIEARANISSKMDLALQLAACEALKVVPDSQVPDSPAYLKRYVAHLRQSTPQDHAVLDGDTLQMSLQECELTSPMWSSFAALGRALPSVLTGEADPEQFISAEVERDFYEGIYNNHGLDGAFQVFLDLLSHENGQMQVLEISAGTTAFTKQIMSMFNAIEAESGGSAFGKYVFKDISPDSLDRCQGELKEYAQRMEFQTWGLENEPNNAEFGPYAEEYDIIFAGNVLLNTPDIAMALANIRKLLKPEGYLVFQELTSTHSALLNVGLASLERRWKYSSSWKRSPFLVTTDEWNNLLSRSGFSHIQLSLKDSPKASQHTSTIMITKVLREGSIVLKKPTLHGFSNANMNGFKHGGFNGVSGGTLNGTPKDIPSGMHDTLNDIPIDNAWDIPARGPKETSDTPDIRDRLSHDKSCVRYLIVVREQRSPESVAQTSLSEWITSQHEDVSVIPLADVKSEWIESPEVIVISLLDVGSPCLADLADNEFQAIQSLIRGCKNILWVAGPNNAQVNSMENMHKLKRDPRFDLAVGLLRTVRSEESSKRISTLIVDPSHHPKEIANAVAEILYSTFGHDGSSSSPEVEHLLQDNVLMIGRIRYEKQLDQRRMASRFPQEYTEPLSTEQPLILNFEQGGMIDSLHFIEDELHSSDLASDEVEIEAAVWPISLRDVLIVLGKVDSTGGLGYECAGIVTRVGSEVLAVKPGDRVAMVSLGSMRTHPRCKVKNVRRIPDSLSFEDAIAPGNPSLTAWQGLVNIARIKKGESILIHSAGGATGQMAVQISQIFGAIIYATVGSEEKKNFLATHYGIPEENIFHSRDTSFAQSIKRVTNGRGVDIVLNSLAGDSLQESWACIAPFGRFLEIGKVDIMANSMLSMAKFAKNALFAAIDMVDIVMSNEPLMSDLVDKTMSLVTDGTIKGPVPYYKFPMGEVEKAFRLMQSGKHTGRIMLVKTGGDLVKKRLTKNSTCKFESNASYVIVGGLGGLGRVIIEWMVSMGAKNFLIPSRSGASSKTAQDLVERLRSQDVCIATPQCDVSSTDDFSDILEKYTTSFPNSPVKGCINSAMVIEDAIFENMTYDQWTRTIRSKVNSSWNLHNTLPHDMDFFIMLSSLVGVYGALGQSNYAAGCAFQDSLAQARSQAHTYGGVSVSLDLGWFKDAGVVAEREDYRKKWETSQEIAGIDSADLIAVLDHYCSAASNKASPENESLSRQLPSQLLLGACTPADLPPGGDTRPWSLDHPLFRSFARKRDSDGGATANPETYVQMLSARFHNAQGHQQRREIVVEALADKLARALGVGTDDIDTGKPVSTLGVDSLMAVELRNWIQSDFGVDILVFELLGGASVLTLGEMVAERTKASE